MYRKKIKSGYHFENVVYDSALKYEPSASAGVVNHEGKDFSLVSYTTSVINAHYDEAEDCYYLECTGTYSATTRRHIGAFLREYFPAISYYTMKDAAKTGELVRANKA
jgi:hypothetical protein